MLNTGATRVPLYRFYQFLVINEVLAHPQTICGVIIDRTGKVMSLRKQSRRSRNAYETYFKFHGQISIYLNC
jgi:hypothetical protein